MVALDQATKAAIQATFTPGDEVALLPVLSLVLTFNKGFDEWGDIFGNYLRLRRCSSDSSVTAIS